QFIDEYLVSERDRDKLRAVVAQLFQPLFDELGWEPKAGEADETRLLRAQLLHVLGYSARLQSISKEGEARLLKYLADPTSLEGSLADVVVSLAALDGHADRWEDFRQRARNARTPDAALRFRFALARFEDPALIEKTLQLTIGDEIPP